MVPLRAGHRVADAGDERPHAAQRLFVGGQFLKELAERLGRRVGSAP
ncbi:hypothetical protein M877_08260 [Streptomyces niveus NCIMB 11891]|nr:hypothetical protein M877_08260 [Streptomyces niveus NCIMB 11891]